MKFTLDGVYCSHLVIIDDAEQTPGASRTITRFRQECVAPIEIAMIDLKPADSYTDLSEIHSLVSDILVKHGFKIDRAEFVTNRYDGLEKATFDIHSEV